MATNKENIVPVNVDYIPIVSNITMTQNDSFYKLDPKVNMSTNIDYPQFSLGFHHYIHASKNKLEILEQFRDKKKVYLVLNKFERYIDNYDEDIGHYSEKYFNITKNIPNILSREFYKLWELFFMFNVIDNSNKNNFISAHLAEGVGSSVQATMFFRDKYSGGKSKNDKYYAITLHKDDEGNHIPELDKSFVDYYEKEKPKRFILHKTYSTQVAGGYKNKDNGDLTNPKTISLFGGQITSKGEKADLVTADGGFDWENENTQEQEAFRLIFAQILTALKIQNKGGNFICKFYETCTDSSVKLLYLLSQMYTNVYLVKPLTSRLSNSEKYAVCLGFKFNETDDKYKSIVTKLTNIHTLLHVNKDKNIVDIWPEINITENITLSDPLHKFKITMIYVNKTIANKQYKNINEMIQFINNQNYYGDSYQMHRQMQIDASKYWIKLFMPENEIDTVLNNIRKSTNETIEKVQQSLTHVKYI